MTEEIFKQEAVRLTNKFKGFDMTNEKYAIKEVAILCIDEILSFLSLQIGFYDADAVKYFNEVKKEVKKLPE